MEGAEHRGTAEAPHRGDRGRHLGTRSLRTPDQRAGSFRIQCAAAGRARRRHQDAERGDTSNPGTAGAFLRLPVGGGWHACPLLAVPLPLEHGRVSRPGRRDPASTTTLAWPAATRPLGIRSLIEFLEVLPDGAQESRPLITESHGVSLDGTLMAHLPARAAVPKRCLILRISRALSSSFWTSLHSARHSSCPERRMIASFKLSTATCASASSASALSRAG